MSETGKILLQHIPLFAGIPKPIYEQLGKAIIDRELAAGDVLFREGDVGKTLYVIKSGTMEILKADPASGKQIRLAIRCKGDFFGEMSLLEDAPRFATARALDDTVVLELSREAFSRLIAENSSCALEVMRALCTRLRQADVQMLRDLERNNEQLKRANRKFTETIKKLEESSQEVKSARRLLEKIISASQFFTIVADSQGEIIIFNEAARRVFGYEFADVAGSGIKSVIAPVANDDLAREIDSALSHGQTWAGDIMTETKTRQRIFIQLVGSGVYDENGNVLAALYMGRDVTAEKNIERQIMMLDRMATRGEMAAEIAHELNNYLSIVLGNLELLELELQLGKTSSAPKKIDSMKNGLEKIAGFTDGLIMYSRPEIKKEKFDLCVLLENEMFFLKLQNRFSGVEFVGEYDPNTPLVTADKSQIQQAVLNLLNNAADATADGPPGQRKITVKTEYEVKTDSVTISVIDNGIGLGTENIHRVFKQHFTTKKTGHGFGLLAVKRVIKDHQGSVWAENNPGGGAKFCIKIPVSSKIPRSSNLPVKTC